jgi:hypothetical protein
MTVSASDFWKRAVQSRAISADEAATLLASFERSADAVNAEGAAVAKWLVKNHLLSPYQAGKLLAGQVKTFVYGDYKLFDRITDGPLAGLFRAVHTGTGQNVLLYFCEPNAPQDWDAAQRHSRTAFAAKYPQAGRVFGMVEGGSRRFLVSEDIKVGPTPETSVFDKSEHVAPKPKSDDVQTGRTAPADEFESIFESPRALPQKKSSGFLFLLSGIGACIALLAVAGIVLFGRGSNENASSTASPEVAAVETEQPANSSETASLEKTSGEPRIAADDTLGSTELPANKIGETQELTIADDGHSLWSSPTDGPPIDLRYLPSGGQMFLLVRPAALLASEEGERVWVSLDPYTAAARDFISTTTGIESFADIERLLIGFFPIDGAKPQMAFVVTLKEAKTKDQLLQAWKMPTEAGKRKKFYQGESWSYYIPPETNGRQFAVAPDNLMAEMLEMDGPPLLRREMEKLLRDTDDSRHLTLLVAPNFLFVDEESVLSGPLAKVKKPLLAYLGEGTLAAEVSFHLADESLFGELRVYGPLDRTPVQLAETYRSRIGELPASIEEYLAGLQPHEYGRLVLTRYPRMLGELANHTRVADGGKHALLRCYLPVSAAHNLALATELALTERPGVASATVAKTAAAPGNAAAAIRQTISLSFPRNTLEKCMEMLADEIGVSVHIEGKDLQLEGITKNQSFGLDERSKPADEILRKVMLLANPDGKLVYVIRPLEPGGKDVVFVTTRAAAAKRGDKLPAELEQPPGP